MKTKTIGLKAVILVCEACGYPGDYTGWSRNTHGQDVPICQDCREEEPSYLEMERLDSVLCLECGQPDSYQYILEYRHRSISKYLCEKCVKALRESIF